MSVAVTGRGVVTSLGEGADAFFDALAAGASGIVDGLSTASAFDPERYMDPRVARRTDRYAQFGVAAADQAATEAALADCDPDRVAVIIGTGVGGLITLQEQCESFLARGERGVSPNFVPMMMPNAAAGAVAIRHGLHGPGFSVASACATGAHAIGEGMRMIERGAADVVVAGGTEFPLTCITLAAFSRMGALSTRNDDPARASRPFDAARDGFVIAEGAGFVVLEPLERALGRGVHVYGEVAGYGRNADAYHITAPSPGGAGAAACMQQALDDAGLGSADIGHINAHGTSTELNDAAEAEAIRKVFGDGSPPVTSTKGVFGHMIGGAGAAEAVVALCSIRDGVVPPTANFEQLGADIDLDVVSGSPREIGPAPVVSNSFGFGGHNATLVLTPTG